MGNAVMGLLGGGLLLAAVSMTASIADRSDVPVEAISGTTVAVAVGAAAVVAAGLIALAVTKNRDVLLLSALATVLLLLTIAGLFSIGIVVLPFTIGAIYLLVRRSSGRRGLSPALVAGPAISVALSVLWIIWIQEPLVQCGQGGVTTTSRPWWNNASSSGQSTSGHVDRELVTTGTIETPAGKYVFRCTDGKLTQFRHIGRG